MAYTFCGPLLLRPERRHQHMVANVRERPSVSLRMGPLFDIRGSVLDVGKRAQDTVYRNRETALARPLRPGQPCYSEIVKRGLCWAWPTLVKYEIVWRI
jgi:hypothetical protein